MSARWAHRAQVACLAVMTAGALDVSYFGLYSAAANAQVPHARLWPILVDGFGLSMSLTVWRARKVGQPAPQARAMLYGVTAMSMGLQVLSSPPDTLARIAHGWPPLLVLLAFEQLLWVITREKDNRPAPAVVTRPRRTRASRSSTADRPGGHDDARELPPALTRPSPGSTGGPVTSPNRPRTVTGPAGGQRRSDLAEVARVVAELEQVGEHVTGRAVAERVGCDPSTGRRKLRELRKAVAGQAVAVATPVELSEQPQPLSDDSIRTGEAP